MKTNESNIHDKQKKRNRLYYYRRIGLSPEQADERERQYQAKHGNAALATPEIEAKRARQREWVRNKRAQQRSGTQDIDLMFVCPCCRSRIYASKGSE